MQEIRSIALWGDSVMRGVVYDEQRGRYGLLPENAADRASRTLGLTLYNRSRMGCTVTKGLSIMKRDIEAGVEPQAALIEFGGNDCDYDWAMPAGISISLPGAGCPGRTSSSGWGMSNASIGGMNAIMAR